MAVAVGVATAIRRLALAAGAGVRQFWLVERWWLPQMGVMAGLPALPVGESTVVTGALPQMLMECLLTSSSVNP